MFRGVAQLVVCEQRTVDNRLSEAKSPKQGAEGASEPSNAWRLCDGVFSPGGRAEKHLKTTR